MKNSLRKGLIATLTAFFAIMIAFVIFTNVNFAKADAIAIPDDANAPRVTGQWTDDFYVIDGASVRLETEGLKFTTVVTKAYMQELTSGGATVEFFATAKKAGGTAKAVTYKYQPEVATMGEKVNLNTYLNFDNVSDEDMATACATDFVVETYAKITNGNDVSYVRAYKPENNDISRSMQVVANAYYLESGDEALKTYFTEGNRSAIDTGYVSLEDGSSKFTMPKVELEGTVNAYVGTKKYTGTVDADGKLVLSGLDIANVQSAEKVNVSIFDGNTVYTTKLVAADIALTNDNISELLEVTSGYVVLAENIDMATAYTDNDGLWTSETIFNGMLDGQGYRINNLKTGTGLFHQVGGCVKDISVLDVALTGTAQTGALAKQASSDLTIDNVIFTVASIDIVSWIGGAPLFGEYRTSSLISTSVNNSILWNKINTATIAAQIAYAPANIITINNCYLIGSASEFNYESCGHGQAEHLAGTYNEYTKFDDLVDAYFEDQVVGVSDMITDFILEDINIVKIGNDNVASLLTATSGIYQFVEDIDMSTAYTSNDGVWASTTTFNGIIDGQGHTITNFKTSTGLFNKVGGRVKNLAIIDATLVGTSQTGILANTASSNLVVNNVIFTVGSMEVTYWEGGAALFGKHNASNTITVDVNNSILWNKNTNYGIAVVHANWNPANVINFNNCYLVGGSHIVYYEPCGHGREAHVSGIYSKYGSISALVEAYNNKEVTNVSDMVINFIDTNKNA